MNCQEALELLYDIIDREATEVDTDRVQAHLNKCRHCFSRYQVEKEVQEFINSRLNSSNSSSELSLDSLKSKISGKLDEIDNDTSSKSIIRRFFPGGSITMAALAALVVLVIGAFATSTMFHHEIEFSAIEEAHLAVYQQLNEATQNSHTSEAVLAVQNQLDYSLLPKVKGLELVSGNFESVGGVPMSHFVYAGGNRLVSVFVTPADKFAIPDGIQQHSVQNGQFSFFDHDCPGCHLVFHQVGNAVVITASSDSLVDLFEFVPGKGIM